MVILQSLTNVEHSGTWSLNWLTAACANGSNWLFWTNFWNYLSLEVILWNRKHQSELLNKLVFPAWFNVGISYHKREKITVALAFLRLLLQKNPTNQPTNQKITKKQQPTKPKWVCDCCDARAASAGQSAEKAVSGQCRRRHLSNLLTVCTRTCKDVFTCMFLLRWAFATL